jgi:hypothetical protein
MKDKERGGETRWKRRRKKGRERHEIEKKGKERQRRRSKKERERHEIEKKE